MTRVPHDSVTHKGFAALTIPCAPPAPHSPDLLQPPWFCLFQKVVWWKPQGATVSPDRLLAFPRLLNTEPVVWRDQFTPLATEGRLSHGRVGQTGVKLLCGLRVGPGSFSVPSGKRMPRGGTVVSRGGCHFSQKPSDRRRNGCTVSGSRQQRSRPHSLFFFTPAERPVRLPVFTDVGDWSFSGFFLAVTLDAVVFAFCFIRVDV